MNIGELFQDINHRNDKNKMKRNHEIQKLLADLVPNVPKCDFLALKDI